MNNSLELNEIIGNLENKRKEILNQLIGLDKEIEEAKDTLRKLEKEEEFQNKEKTIIEFMKKEFGLSTSEIKENRWNLHIVFNKSGDFIKVINRLDFGYTSDVERYLKQEKVYAHSLSSFINRNIDFYNLDFKEQLKNLGWEFGKRGKLIKTAW